MILDIY